MPKSKKHEMITSRSDYLLIFKTAAILNSPSVTWFFQNGKKE